MFDMDNMRSIFVIPNQCRISGIKAWNRIYQMSKVTSWGGGEGNGDYIFDSGDAFCAFKVLGSPVAGAFSDIINEVFCNFAEGTTFLAEIDDNARTSCLSFFDGFFDAK